MESAPRASEGAREVGRNVLLAVQFEHQPLEDVSGAPLFVDQPGRDGPVAVGQVPEEAVELLAARFLVHGQPFQAQVEAVGQVGQGEELVPDALVADLHDPQPGRVGAERVAYRARHDDLQAPRSSRGGCGASGPKRHG